MPPPTSTPISSTFTERKRKILSQLDIPEDAYTDLSPKGSVDAGIRGFVDEINALPGFVTTSSCAGRVSVFVDGSGKKVTASVNAVDPDDDIEGDEDQGDRNAANATSAAGGGKGGGSWLFVSHDSVDLAALKDDGDVLELCGFGRDSKISFPSPDGSRPRFVHFRFEPMILHMLTASPTHATHAHTSAMSAGFRESGIHSILPPNTTIDQTATPLVAIRTAGLAFSSIVGYLSPSDESIVHMVPPAYFSTLLRLANQRFELNAERTERFRRALLGLDAKTTVKEGDGPHGEWEDAEARKERKRREGLRRREEVLNARQKTDDGVVDDATSGLLNLGGVEDVER
ncbi:trna wybutosine-synthesizing protein [Zymoseptoria brevis]|uniref:tRNA(Phe) 7-[(3-amino-3-carboxypropyl)-4-demethylwyosine(37)-N(4)]-methyltransferase n=1 Tax=Zymoseptoria brevis TaxID=1047168 RepID=A0A0F4GGR7_9PEZI|nr:trna wybutosine-synthesizing protein [Zymoseptoria brevis]